MSSQSYISKLAGPDALVEVPTSRRDWLAELLYRALRPTK